MCYIKNLLMAEIKPTPAPAINLPTTIMASSVEAVSRIQPTENTMQPDIIVHRRPILSARSPAMMAPKKVPQERIPVRRDCCHPGRTKAAISSALASTPGYFPIVSVVFESRQIWRCKTHRKASVLADIIFHTHNSSHPSSIVSEEDTSECCESTHQVGFHCHWSFDPGGVPFSRISMDLQG